MAARMNSEQVLKTILAKNSDSELSSLACTSSEDSESDEEPYERDFSDQEVGIKGLIQLFCLTTFCNLITFTKFSGYLGLLGENYIWEHLQNLLVSKK